MAKKVFMGLSVLGLVALAIKEFPALVRELNILRMGSAPQGPSWHQRAGGS